VKTGVKKIASMGIFLALCLISSTSFGLEQILRVSDGKIVDLKQMVQDIKGANFIFVGEVHSNLKHHQAQLNIIKALFESKITLAIGLEMFRASSQKELDQWVRGTMPLGVFVDVYSRNWGMPWPWYMNILKYARQFDIPLIGLNVESGVTEKVSRQGFESLTNDELKQLPPHISFDLDDQYQAHLRKVYEAHGKGDTTFENFYKAQMIWDETMGYHLMNFLNRNPGTTVVVLSGVDHAGKKGIPRQITKKSKYQCKVIVPEIRGGDELYSAKGEDADYILLE
jgi:uncharacterized iron-regulated protein